MTVVVLHGDDIGKSYGRLAKFFDEAKRRNWEIIQDELTLTPSLFGRQRLIVFRKYNLLSKKDIKNLSKFDGTLVIYNEGLIPQSFIKTLPKATKVEKYDLPKIIFQFLDTFSIRLFHRVIEAQPPEFVFALLAKRLRDLYWVKTDPNTILYQPWQISRLKKQAQKFSFDQLKDLINELAKIDVEVKTGKSNLISSLDLLIIEKLK